VFVCKRTWIGTLCVDFVPSSWVVVELFQRKSLTCVFWSCRHCSFPLEKEPRSQEGKIMISSHAWCTVWFPDEAWEPKRCWDFCVESDLNLIINIMHSLIIIIMNDYITWARQQWDFVVRRPPPEERQCTARVFRGSLSSLEKGGVLLRCALKWEWNVDPQIL